MTLRDFLASLPAAVNLRADGTFKDVLAAIRRDLKLAVAAEQIPKHAKFSVRTLGHKTVRVELVAWHGEILHAPYAEATIEHVHELLAAGKEVTSANMAIDVERRQALREHDAQDPRLTDEINHVMLLVLQLTERHNFHERRPHCDYDAYGYTTSVNAHVLVAMAERGLRLELDKAFAEIVAKAHAAALRVGDNVVRSICGAAGVDGACESALSYLIELDRECTSIGSKPTYDKRQFKWIADWDASPLARGMVVG